MYNTISKYIENLSLSDINKFAKKNNINLLNNEDEIIYEYIKKYYKDLFFNEDNTDIFKSLKCKLSFNTYEKIEKLYNDVKEKIKNNS